jgi:hypothetical protein
MVLRYLRNEINLIGDLPQNHQLPYFSRSYNTHAVHFDSSSYIRFVRQQYDRAFQLSRVKLDEKLLVTDIVKTEVRDDYEVDVLDETAVVRLLTTFTLRALVSHLMEFVCKLEAKVCPGLRADTSIYILGLSNVVGVRR